MTTVLSGSSLAHGRGRWRSAVTCATAAFFLAWFLRVDGAGLSTGFGGALTATGLPALAFLGLAGSANGHGDVGDLVARVERFLDGEDVAFDTDRDDEVGRLYEAVGTLAGNVREHDRDMDEAERYRQQLYRITADTERDSDEKIRRLLELGCERLDLENGLVTHIDAERDSYEIVTAAGGDFVEEGTTSDLMDTFCRETITADDVLGIFNAREAGFENDPGYTVWNINCYIGGKIEAGDGLYGTVCFVDPEPRAEEFTHDEKAFVDLVARWVSHELDRRERIAELRVRERALEAAPVGVTITDPDREDNPVVDVNERFTELTDYPEAAVLGRNCRFLQGEGTAEEPVAELREAVDAGEPVTTELRNYRRDGTEFWNRVSVAPVEDDDGAVTNFVGFQEDVTERREYQRRLEAIVQDTTTPIYIKDSDGVYQFANEAAATYFGLPVTDVVGTRDEDLFDAESAARMRAVDERVMETGDPATDETHTRVDGEDRVFLDNKYPYRDRDGEIVGVVGISRDVTEREERQRELRETKRRLELALEGADMGIWEWHVGTDEIEWNETLERLVGLDPGGFGGTYEAFKERVHPDDAARVEQRLRDAVEGDGQYRTEFRYRHEDGDWLWFRARGRVVDDGDERMVGIVYDVTERKEYERQLEEERDRFATLFESLPNPAFRAVAEDQEPIVREVNAAFAETFGVDREEISGERLHDYIDMPPAEERRLPDLNREIVESGGVRTEVRRETVDGLRTFQFDVTLRERADGSPEGYCVYTDVTERKEQARELQETNERLGAVIDASPDAIVAFDLDANVELWNPAAERIFGWEAAEVEGAPPPYVPEDETDEFEEFADRLRAGETFTAVETRRRRKDGDLIDVSISGAPLRDSDGEVVGAMAVLEDITDRKRAERRSREREAQLERYREYTDDVLDAVDDVFYVLDDEGNLLRWNESLAAVTGYSDEEIGSMHALEFFPADARDAIDGAIEEVFETGDTRVEAPFLTKEGEQIPHEFVASRLEDPDGNTVLAGVGRDVTEREERERQLRERERRLQRYREYTEDVLDAIDDVFYIVDEEWNIRRWNDSLAEVSGYADEEIAEMSVRDFFDPDDADQVVAALEDIENRTGDPLEVDVVTKGGASLPFEFVAAPLEDPDGNRVIAGIGRDISERKRYAESLERTTDLLQRVQRIAQIGGWELDLTTDPPAATWTEEMYRLHDMPSDADVDLETILATYHPDDRDRVRETVERSIEEGSGYDIEARMTTGPEGARWVRAIGDPVYGDGEGRRAAGDGAASGDGDLVKFQGAVQDVTERKRREAELERTKDLLQQAGRIAGFGGWELDVTTDPPEMTWTDELYEIHGVPRDARITVETTLAQYHPDDRDYMTERFEAAIERGESYDMEVRALADDGDVRWVRALGEAVYEGDEIVKLRGSIQDITDQKRREQELERTKDLLAQAEELADVGGWEIDLQSGDPDLFWTSELYRLHGLAPGTDIDIDEGLEFYHPDDRERIREAVEAAIERGEPYDVEARLQPADGGQRWVRAIGDPVTEDGEVVRIRGSLQDVTGVKEREEALRSLHEAARGLLGTETETGAAELVVETAASVLDVPYVGVYLLDEDTNRLEPAAYTDAFERVSGGAPSIAAHEDPVIWNAFAAGNRTVFGNDDAGRSPVFGEDVDAGLVVPVGEYGVFALATEDRGIDDATRRLVETFVATAEAAFDRLENEATLRERDRELEEQNQRLRRQIQITEIIRGIDQSLVGATSREEIETAVCERLAEADDVSLAWVGTVDAADEELVARTWDGEGRDYLHGVPLTVDEDNAEPAVTAARTGQATVVPNVARRLRGEAWRREALANGYHSVVAVPLTFEGYSYGVLTVYADEPGVFDDLERTVFVELGRSIANAITAVKTRTALHADSLAELTLRMADEDDVLSRAARRLDATVEYEGLASQSGGETRLFLSTAAPTDAVRAVLEDLVDVRGHRLVSEDDEECLFEVTVGGTALASKLVRHGASPRSITATPSGTEVVADVPTTTDVREFLTMLRETYPSVELGARRDVERTMATRQQLVSSLFEDLTDRQLEVLRTAYLAGYFEWPRRSTGEDVAEMLGVTQPTVNRHLRLGQQRLLAQLFEEEATAVAAG